MDTFLVTFPAIMFKIAIVLFALLLVTGTTRRLVIKKTIKAILEAPDKKRQRLVQVYERTVSTWRIAFWAAPIYLVGIPIGIYFFLPEFFRLVVTLMIGVYVMLIDDFFYKRLILKSIGKMEGEKQ